MTTLKTYPFFIKATVSLLGLVLCAHILGALGSILVPFFISGLIAVLLNPLTSWLEKRIPRLPAVLISLVLALAVFGTLLYFLSTQIATFTEMMPAIKLKFFYLITELQHWINATFGVSMDKQMAMMKQTLQGSQALVGSTLNRIISTVGVVFLMPIYLYLLLFYKPLILDFLFRVFSEKNSLRVAEILSETKHAIQAYIIGLLIETTIVATLNCLALLVLGVPNALLIGIIGGILNMLPYIGGLVAIALPVLMATVVKDGYTTQLAVVGLYLLIQFIDNNILVPRIISSKVQINALISILVVLMGGLLWGIGGMFLSIPFVAVLKIIFDRVDGLKPWGVLMGTTVPIEHSGVKWQNRWDRIFRRIHRDDN
ncbi:MAG: AI-2E family transporter [Taibaiella sp.]|nr:AI-2E family transporter [Taibaiella sp.]